MELKLESDILSFMSSFFCERMLALQNSNVFTGEFW